MKTSAASAGPLMFVATVLFLLQFTGVWIWPAAQTAVTDAGNSKPFGFALNVAVYVSVIGVLSNHLASHGISLLAKALAPFLPLIAWALVCCVFGLDFAASLKMWALWVLTILAGALIGLEVERPVLVRWFLLFAAAALWGSVLWAVARPSVGLQLGFWRGLLLAKNYLGWLAALTLVTLLAAPVRTNRLVAAAAGSSALICLVFSGAKTALVTVAGVTVYQMLLRMKHRTVEGRFGAILLLMILCAVVPLYGLDLLLGLLGKDPTLTGRTVIWGVFFQKALERPFAGFGPGAFGGASDITASFLQGFEEFGEIRTPHNIYLSFFGDTGIVGVVLLVTLLIRLTLVRAATDLSVQYRWPALLAFAIVIEGMAEAIQGFGNNTVWFLLAAALASAVPRRASLPQGARPRRFAREGPVRHPASSGNPPVGGGGLTSPVGRHSAS